MKAIIRVQNLGKQYRLGRRERAPYGTLRESLAGAIRAPLRQWSTRQTNAETSERFWALKNIEFEVVPGEVLGIVGRNGAGKSTLLKILSRVTEPTEGGVDLYGRVGSLLEVGTGFHPELSGRENIYLNGAILGMSRTEIRRKIDPIVAFAEVETFLDTPVKHYSSGMYLKLAFAVAAHLETEVLIIDEVLTVGDMKFQSKCLGKMKEVAHTGRTVMFVSHQLSTVMSLCTRAILLADGVRIADGPAPEVVRQYMELGHSQQGERTWDDRRTAPGNSLVQMQAVRIVSDGAHTADTDISSAVEIHVEYQTLTAGDRFHVSIHLIDQMGVTVLASSNAHCANLAYDDLYGVDLEAGKVRTVCVLPADFLNEGRYTINAYILNRYEGIVCSALDVVSFRVHDTGAMRGGWGGTWCGVIRPRLAWNSQYTDLGTDRT